MADLRGSVVYLLRLRIPWRAEHLATLAAVPLSRARAFVTDCVKHGAVTIDADGAIKPGTYARRWIALEPKTRPGGNASEYRRQREVRAELEQLAWLAERQGKLLTSNDEQPDPSMTTMIQTRPGATNGDQVELGVPAALTLDQAAIALGCSRNTVRARVHDGTLKAVKLGRLVRIPRIEVDRINAGETRRQA